MAAKRLNIENDNTIFVLAISCHQPGFKLAWEINRTVNCELVNTEQYEENIPFIQSIDGHAYYNWTDTSERYTLHFINNQGVGSILLPEYKQIDYFFIATGFFEELNLDQGIKNIKQINSVLTAFPIDIKPKKK